MIIMEKMDKMVFKSFLTLSIIIVFSCSITAQNSCDQYSAKLKELQNYKKQNNIDQAILTTKAAELLVFMESCFKSKPTTDPEKEVQRYYLLGRAYYDANELTEAGYFLKKCRDHAFSGKTSYKNKTYRELSNAMYQATTYAQTSANRRASGSLSYSGKGGYIRELISTFDEVPGEPFTSQEIENFAARRISYGHLSEEDLTSIKLIAEVQSTDYEGPFIVVGDEDEVASDWGGQTKVVFSLDGEVDSAEEEKYTSRLLRFYEFLTTEYGLKTPENYITVYLNNSEFSKDGYQEFSAFANKIHGRNAGGRVAYYNPMDQSVVCWIKTGVGTLNHEVVHALIVQDFSDIPGWLNEGLGAMYEETAGNDYEPLDNYRLIYLKEAMKQGVFPDLRQLVTADDAKFDADKETMLYAAAGRYLMIYLREKNQLADIYQYLRDYPSESKEDYLDLILGVLEVDENQFNTSWKNWILSKQTPEKWESLQKEIKAYIDELSIN